MKPHSQIAFSLFFCLFAFSKCAETAPQLRFPLQFSASVAITANAIPAAQKYPPRHRKLRVWYDYPQKRAKAEIEGGYEAAKLQLRRYDLGNEYMVRHDPINDCTRSYLGDKMPFPELPKEGVEYLGQEVVAGEEGEQDVLCDHWLYSEYNDRIHIYMDAATGAPRRLMQVYEPEPDKAKPMLTYDYTDVVLGKQDEDDFALPEGYSHQQCTRHVGGFPYLHVFHYFVKF